MKHIVGLLLLAGLLPLAVQAQEEIMTLNTQELGTHQRPLVIFKHQAHADQIDCARCHHDYDEFGVNQNSDGQRCIECHPVNGEENPIDLVSAFHRQCKNCHQKLNLRARNTAKPEMCGQCHRQQPVP